MGGALAVSGAEAVELAEAVEVPEAVKPAEAVEVPERRSLGVDAVGDPLLHVLQDSVGLRTREPAVGDRVVEAALDPLRHRVDQAAHALASILGDLRQRLAAGELLSELRLGQP